MPDSTNEIPPGHRVKVKFRGFIVTQIKHGTNSAVIGALQPSISTCHQPKIQVYKIIPPGDEGGLDGRSVQIGAFDLNEDFDLSVTPAPPAGIQIYQKDEEPFERHDERHNDRRDFRWFVDLDDLHKEPVTVDLTKLHPKFTMNKGLFHTSVRTDGEFRIRPHDELKPVRHYGKSASEITARVYLEPGSSARFSNGPTEIFTVTTQPGDVYRYNIIYDCSCLLDEDEGESDFPLIYDVVSVSDPKKKVHVEREDQRDEVGDARTLAQDVRTLSPEVYCMGGNRRV